MTRDAYQKRLFRQSGSVRSDDPIVCFLYLLMRDKLPPGEVATLMKQAKEELAQGGTSFTNGWLAQYARHLAREMGRK